MTNQLTFPKYSILPPRTGVPFGGFEYARLESRKPVENAIRSFISDIQRSKSINVTLIKAEWGEGKTDAYERYIKNTLESYNDLSFSVATSTIGDKISRVNDIFNEESSSASKFLACVFAATRDELRTKTGNGGIFENRKPDALEYIKDVFRTTQNSCIVLFIDEFEELLGFSSDKQKSILSGIKELVNGQIGFLHEGGEYSGKFHLIIAVTPYAYNRIKDNPDLAEIFGSFASRLKIIDLPQLKKYEIYQYILDLLKYSYGGVLPEKIPFASTGILNGLGVISQKNPRALVQLFCELMSQAEINGQIKLINYEHLIQSLKNEEISIYGGSTKCIDSELYEKIIGYLHGIRKSKECIEIFKLLTGELKPFSASQINDRQSLDDDEIHSCIELINQELKKIGIQQAITRYVPLNEDKTFDDIIDSLSPGEGQIQLLNSTIQIDKLKDEMIFFEFTDDSQLKPFVVFPKEVNDVEAIFDLDKPDAEELHRKISRKNFDTTAKGRYYFLSHELISQMFPSPILLLVDFIKNRNKRMELWRDVVKNRMELKEKFGEAFSDLINKTEKLKIQTTNDNSSLQYLTNANRKIDIPCKVFAFPGGVNQNDLNQIKQQIHSKNIPLTFIVYIGEIDSLVQEELAQLPILSIHIRPIRAQQMLIQRIAHGHGIEINSNLLDLRFSEIINELNIEKTFEDWLNIRRRQGIVIDDLLKKSGKSDKEIASSYKIFINLTGRTTTLEEVYSCYDKLNGFRIYGKSSDLNPLDIESISELELFRENLTINHFIEQQNSDFFSIKDTPIELRILSILESGNIKSDVIKGQFINLSSNEEIISQVYLPILEHKGKILVKSGIVGLVPRDDALNKINRKYEGFIADLDTKRKSNWWTFAHICASKDRDDVKFTLDQYVQLVKKLKQNLESQCDENVLLQRIRLIDLLIDHYNEKLSLNINNAFGNGQRIFTDVKMHFTSIDSNLESIIHNYNNYTKDRKYIKNELDEYTHLSKLFDHIQKIWENHYSVDDITHKLKTYRSEFRKRDDYPFYFRKGAEDASYFNLKYYLLSQSINEFNNYLGKINQIEEKITENITKIETLDTAIRGKLLLEEIDPNLKLSAKIFQFINSIKNVPIEAECSSRLVLSDLENFFSSSYYSREQFKKQLDSFLKNLNLITQNEKDLQKKIADMKCSLKNYSKFVKGINEYSSRIQGLDERIEKIKEDYEALIFNFEDSDMGDLSLLISNLESILVKIKLSGSNIQGIEVNLRDIDNEFIEAIDEYKKGNEKIFEIFKNEGSIQNLKHEFDLLYASSITMIKKVISITPEKSWETLHNELDTFREKFFRELSKIIPDEESNVLFELVNILPKKGWKDYLEIVKTISKKLQISEEETEKLITKLTERGIIRKGLSYSN